MNYSETAKRILGIIGGARNIKEITLCSGRIRMILQNLNLVDESKLHEVKEIIGIMNHQEELQLVVGSQSKLLFESILQEGHMNGSIKEEGEASNKWDQVFNFLSDVFLPVIPLLVGVGALKVLLAILLYFGTMSKEGSLYLYSNYLADAVLYFFPFVIGISVCCKLKSNPFLGMIVVGVLFQPYLYWNVEQGGTNILGLPISMSKYSVGILPIIFCIWMTHRLYYAMKQIFSFRGGEFLRPIVTAMISISFVILLIGPLAILIGNVLSIGILIFMYLAKWIAPAVIAATAPFLLLLGVLYGQVPLGTTLLSTVGIDTIIGPGILACFVAQGTAAICVGLKAKRKSAKRLGIITGVLALFGFAEPAILGVNLRYRKPVLAGVLGGAIGGLYFGVMGVGRYGTGLPGILSVVTYKGNDSWYHLLNCLIGILLTMIVTMVLTYRLGFEEQEEICLQSTNEYKVHIHEKQANSSYTSQLNQFRSLQGVNITSPMSGRTLPLQHVNDDIYANEMMGKGVAILPDTGRLVSPVDGRIIILFDTLQGIGIKGEDGSELFIHIGLDTINLDGKYYTPYVKVSDVVKRGQLLMEFDLTKIKQEGYDPTTPINLCNSDDYNEMVALIHQEVKEGDVLMKLLK